MARSLRLRLASLGINKRLVKIYTATFISYMSNAYSVTMVYPFLSAMTKFFLPGEDTASINTYAGFIVAAFFGGRILGSYIWGSLADHFGRKYVLAASTVLMALCSLILAFSVNYGMAVAFRVLLGLCNGILVIIRAVISESSNNVNQTFGFSVLTCSWLLAALMAPLLSGLTSDPITQYNLTLSDGAVKSFLTHFPYSPPYLLNALVCFAGTVIVIFLLPETLDRKSHKNLVLSAANDECSDALVHHHHAGATDGPANGSIPSCELTATGDCEANGSSDKLNLKEPSTHNTDQSLLMTEGQSDELNANVKLHWTDFNVEKCLNKCKSIVAGTPASMKRWLANLISILQNRTTLLVFSAHCLFAVVDTGIDALNALWSATPISLGGLGFTISSIGISSTIVAAICWPFNLFSFPLIARRFGSIQSHQIFAIVFLSTTLLIPNIHFLAYAGQTTAVWILIIASRVILTTSACTCFSAQCIFICNSVTSDKLGRINGIAVFISDIFRTTSPALAGAIYASSLSEQSVSEGFPVDYNLTYVIFGGIALLMTFMAACLPSSINHKHP